MEGKKRPAMDGDRNAKPTAYPAEKARQGEILLRTRARRLIVIAGLGGLVIVIIGLNVALSS